MRKFFAWADRMGWPWLVLVPSVMMFYISVTKIFFDWLMALGLSVSVALIATSVLMTLLTWVSYKLWGEEE